MAVLRNAFDAVLKRLETDEKFRQFFDDGDYDPESKQIVGNYYRIGLGGVGPFEPFKVAAGTTGNTFNSNLMELVVTLVILHDDKFFAIEQVLKGIEIFVNAIQKKDVQFGLKLITQPVIEFEQPVAIEGEGKTIEQIEVNGSIAFQVQPYTGGSL